MKILRFLAFAGVFGLTLSMLAQEKPNAASQQQQTTAAADDVSGMYSFLREGEFVQVTVENDGAVTGFVSRFGDTESDKDSFLDQFFSKAELKADHLTFTTKPIHGTWFEFDGKVERGPGKTPHEEGYRVLRGTLTQSKEDAEKKVTSKSRQVELKSFPQDLDRDVVPKD